MQGMSVDQVIHTGSVQGERNELDEYACGSLC